MSPRQSITFDSTFFASSSMRWSSEGAASAVMVIMTPIERERRAARMARILLAHDLAAQRLGLRDQLREPLDEMRLFAFFGERLRARRHVDELLDEHAQVFRGAEGDDRRCLTLDRPEGL